ncbi:MAG: hypothetical protein JWN56_411 [Sphingobacteriales bacterium]|nr:hypothetical protein [Sphingobacteriales bacterium]
MRSVDPQLDRMIQQFELNHLYLKVAYNVLNKFARFCVRD